MLIKRRGAIGVIGEKSLDPIRFFIILPFQTFHENLSATFWITAVLLSERQTERNKEQARQQDAYTTNAGGAVKTICNTVAYSFNCTPGVCCT